MSSAAALINLAINRCFGVKYPCIFLWVVLCFDKHAWGVKIKLRILLKLLANIF